jgi:hypothetical protein
VADDAVYAARDQGVAGLDGHQAAEAVAENDDWPEPQRSAHHEEHDAGQRTASPSMVQRLIRSVQAGTKAAMTPISPKAAMTQRLPRSSRIPGLMFPPTKSDATAVAKTATVSATSAECEKKADIPPQPSAARPRYAVVPPKANITRAIDTRMAGHLRTA